MLQACRRRHRREETEPKDGLLRVIHILTFVLLLSTFRMRIKSCLPKGRQPGDSGWWSECGACARRLVTAALGRLRASCLPVLRPAREVLSLDWDRRGGGGAARRPR